MIPTLDVEEAGRLLEAHPSDDELLERYAAVVEAADNAEVAGERDTVEIVTYGGTRREIDLGGAAPADPEGPAESPGDHGPGPGGGDGQTPELGPRPAPGHGAGGPDQAERLRPVPGPGVVGALERARRLSALGRLVREGFTRSSETRSVLQEAAVGLGIELEDGDAEMALLADLLQYAAWDAFAIVSRRLDLERANTRRPIDQYPPI